MPSNFSCGKVMILALAGLLPAAPATADQILVPAGADWKYLDNGSNPGTAWVSPFFSDSLWAAGNAELGYGDGDEATITGFGGNPNGRYITTYFRKTFSVPNPAAFSGLTLRLLRDDGAVVYLNGTEVRRDNMPSGAISPGTLASTALGTPAEATFYSSSLAPGLLVSGSNTLAVEIHQANATSSDVSFNLELIGVDSVSVVRGPYLQLGTPGSMIVRWRTNTATAGAVSWGLEPGSLTASAGETAATTEHEIKITGLAPNTRYYYSVGTPGSVLASGPDYQFTTAPPAGTVQPARVWVLGDSGTADANAAAVRDAYTSFTGSTKTDVWLMLGDNAYTNGTDAEFQAAVFDLYPSYLRQTPLWSAVGNHDTASSTNPLLTIPYFQIHNFPTAGEAGGIASGTEKYYSFDYANIHFICLDSMTSSRSPTGPMAVWLQNDLASTVQPWIIAFWHHPAYTKGSHNSDTEAQLVEMRTNLLPFLEAGGVDLVLAGHSHSYERSYLLDGHYGLSGTLTPEMKKDAGSGREDTSGIYHKPGNNAANQGAVYITAGSSGKISGGTLDHPAMFTSLNQLGSLVLDINNTRLDAKFIRENGSIVDYFTIDKSVPNQPPSVALSNPSPGSVYSAPATITLTADAADPDGTIRQVDFYQGNTPIGSAGAPPFEFNWTGVPAGSYLLSAAATDNLGATVTSAPVTVTVQDPLPPVPPAPGNVNALAGNGRVTLSWTSSPGAGSYTVKRAAVSGGPWSSIANGLTTTGYTDLTAVNGSTYYYVITASNAAGESPPSNEISATPVAPLQIPAAPGPLTAALAGKTQINLSWGDNSMDETGFRIERKQGNAAWVQIATTAADVTVFSSTGLSSNKTYSYRIRATNAAGDSAYSNTITLTTPRK